MQRFFLLAAGACIGVLAALAAPHIAPKARSLLAHTPGLSWMVPGGHSHDGHAHDGHGHDDDKDHKDHDHKDHDHHDKDHKHHDDKGGPITLSDAQIDQAGIAVAEVQGGALQRWLHVPGRIAPSGDRIARVAVKILGTVAELRKRPGEPVAAGEVVAVIESREVAEAKSEYLAARLTHDLQRTLATRAKTLSESRAIADNEYLRQRNAHEDAQVKRDSARQKLAALGLTEAEILALPDQPLESLPKQELRSPIAGTVAERRVDLGALVGREGQESELYIIVDLSEVWADLAVSAVDLPLLRNNQEVVIVAGATEQRAPAQIMLIGPLLDKDTHSARVIARLDNADGRWRPGTFITANIPLPGHRAAVVVPKSALQTVKGEVSAFVRTPDGFEKRTVKTGADDGTSVEILSGLEAGERIATSNTFTLKAELGKSEAEHAH
jgi:cobalt-zinc-cadmium efflux system membrane fusion protein